MPPSILLANVSLVGLLLITLVTLSRTIMRVFGGTCAQRRDVADGGAGAFRRQRVALSDGIYNRLIALVRTDDSIAPPTGRSNSGQGNLVQRPTTLFERVLMRRLILMAAVAACAFGSSPASAVVLLEQTNLPNSSVLPQTLTFTATSNSTLLSFQGFNVPGSTTLVNIFLGLTGSTFSSANDILATTFTGTPSGCGAPGNMFTPNSGDTGIYGNKNIVFGGACVGLYDTASQTVSTVAGQSYTLRFSLSNVGTTNNGFRVTIDEPLAGAVPEPGTWAMMILGFGAMGLSLRRRKETRLRLSQAA